MRLIAIAFMGLLAFSALAMTSSNYVTIREGAYGYTGSAPHHKAGELPQPVAMLFIRFLGEKNGEYSFAWNNGAGSLIIEICHRPCDIVLEEQFTGDKRDFIQQKMFGANTGIGQAIQDAMAGHLRAYPIPGLSASAFSVTIPIRQPQSRKLAATQPEPDDAAQVDDRPNYVERFLVFLLILYFIPTALALLRGNQNKLAIFALNLFMGWTVVGWVGSLVWALKRT